MNNSLANTYSPAILKAGLKITLARLLVLRTFHQSEKRHLTADDVYKLMREAGLDIGLATVYRSLVQFAEAGILHRQHFDLGKAVFELTAIDHHDHLVCLSCGKVIEFIDYDIEERQKAIANEHGFQIEDHALTIYGYCNASECRPAR